MKRAYLGLIGIGIFAYGAYMPIKAQLAQYLIHNAWDKSLASADVIKPWPWMDTHPVMRLSSDKHQQDLIVLSGDSGNVLAFAPGHNPQSNKGDTTGTVLISAHRDTHFNFLQAVDIGDEFLLETHNGSQNHYQVSEIQIIDSKYQDITLSDTQSELKLSTCYPFNSPISGGSLRYIVTADLLNRQQINHKI